MRVSVRRRTATGTALAALALGLWSPAPAVVAAAGAPPTGPECLSVQPTDVDETTVRGENEANARLQVPEAQQLARRLAPGRAPGAGVTVVVVDSPVDAAQGTASQDARTGHGRAVAGIVAGDDQTRPVHVGVGIAPGARVESVPFYTTLVSGQGDAGTAPMASGLTRALGTVADRMRSGGYGPRVVVLVPAQVPHSPALERQVARLVRAGALVVAASGDRPAEGQFPEQYAADRPGEDAARVVWPAAAPGVVAVGVAAPERSTVLRSSRIDLAAPGAGAVSRGLNGGWCALLTPSTHWAAAQVAAVAALVWSVHRDDDAARLATRLEQTASGNGGRASAVTGYGVVQPVEALRRRVEAMAEPTPEATTPARRPREQADVLAGVRGDAVWWGLGGGAALVVLIVLRPLLSRRRPT